MTSKFTKKIRDLFFLEPFMSFIFHWRILISAYMFVAISFSTVAQTESQTVTGKVVSATDDSPLPGVSVVISGTTNGTITDVEGNYSIEAKSSDVLMFSYIGYTPEEITVGTKTLVNISLEEDISKLSEVVVVGYGTVKKSDLTGSVASVSGEQLNKSVVSGLDQALIGRVAGVTATQMSGQPGSSVSIRIRGTSSISGGVEPLYVIDGVPVSGDNGTVYDYGLGSVGGGGKSTFSPLSGINPNDIESIEILKDASATAIYGNRGSNGVVIVTTKRGKTGESKISYDGYYGLQELHPRLDMMNLREFAQYQNDLTAETAGEIPRVEWADPSLLGEGTDWQKAIFRVAPMQNHQVTFQGGSGKIRYLLSGNYFDQEGTVVGSNFKRYSLRLNLDSDIRKWLTVGNSLTISRTNERLLQADRGGIINTALKASPGIPEKNFDGTYYSGTEEGAIVSPLAQALDRDNLLNRVQILGNLYADVKILPFLTLRTEFGGNADFSRATTWFPTFDYGGINVNTINKIDYQNNINYSWQVKNYLTFNKTFGSIHNVTLMAGQEASEWGYNRLNGGSSNLPTNDVHHIGLGAETNRRAGSAEGSSALSSYFGRLNYNLQEKYYATLTLRADGSSNFDKNYKWGTFSSAAVAWRISNESFLKGNPIVSNLKLRAGWGQTGNSNIPPYTYGSAMQAMPSGLGGGFRQSRHPNSIITWETAEQVDLGLDAAFLQNRFQLTIDFYRKVVKDLLFPMPLPGYMGSQGNGAIAFGSPWGNFGELENKGLEIEVKTVNVNKGDFSWQTDLNFTLNRNKLIDLGIKDAVLDGATGGAGNILISRTLNGMGIGEFYGYKTAGIFQDKEDILNSPVQYDPAKVDTVGNPIFERTGTVWPGDIKFADIDKNDTIDFRDRTYLGSPQPKFSFGFNNTFSYKGIQLEIFLVGNYGNKIYNFNKQGDGDGLSDMKGGFSNQLKEVINRAKTEPIGEATAEWFNDIDNVRVTNSGTNIPRAIFQDPNQNDRVSDRYVEDGSFLRIRNIKLSYDLPPSIIKKIKMGGIRVYGQVQNAFTFTKYTGYDPEVGQDTWVGNIYGLDNGRYPSPRVYTLGLSANF